MTRSLEEPGLTLGEVIRKLPHIDDERTIFAMEPWCSVSPVRLLAVPDGVGMDDLEAQHPGFKYFLEVFVANEVLEALEPDGGTQEERQALVIYFAEHDCYPEWVEER